MRTIKMMVLFAALAIPLGAPDIVRSAQAKPGLNTSLDWIVAKVPAWAGKPPFAPRGYTYSYRFTYLASRPCQVTLIRTEQTQSSDRIRIQVIHAMSFSLADVKAVTAVADKKGRGRIGFDTKTKLVRHSPKGYMKRIGTTHWKLDVHQAPSFMHSTASMPVSQGKVITVQRTTVSNGKPSTSKVKSTKRTERLYNAFTHANKLCRKSEPF